MRASLPHPPWPLPALLAWALAWLLFAGLQRVVPPVWALLGACAVAVAASLWGSTWWRRGLIAAGFPLALALTGWASVPPWAWLVPLGLLLVVYPLNAWRDAPLFPTPSDALALLPQHAPLPAGARVLDAGCGLGHGLRALHRAYPQAVLHGVEWSWPLRLLCALRCPWARVRQGDMWAQHWGDFEMVYLFQRPESMARAWDKARSELRDGAWLVSLDFAIPERTPLAHWDCPGSAHGVWLYRVSAPGHRPG